MDGKKPCFQQLDSANETDSLSDVEC